MEEQETTHVAAFAVPINGSIYGWCDEEKLLWRSTPGNPVATIIDGAETEQEAKVKLINHLEGEMNHD